MDTKKPDEADTPSGKLRNFSENQRKFFARRRSSKPLEISPSMVNDEVTSGMALIDVIDVNCICSPPLLDITNMLTTDGDALPVEPPKLKIP